MSETVQVGEFTRAIEALSKQIADVQATSRETLTEARKTNGRVNGLERLTAEHGVKLKNLEREVFDDESEAPKPAAPKGEDTPITRRDLWIAVMAVSGAGAVLVAITKWLPALLAAGKVAP